MTAREGVLAPLGLTPGPWRFVRYEGEYSVPVHDVVTDYDEERLPKKVATAYQGNENDIRLMALAKEMAEAILVADDVLGQMPWDDEEMGTQVLHGAATKIRMIGASRV